MIYLYLRYKIVERMKRLFFFLNRQIKICVVEITEKRIMLANIN